MKIRTIKLIIGLLLLTFLLFGCFSVDRSFSGMKNLVMFATDNKYDEEFEFSMGTVSLSVAELALIFSDVDDSVNDIIGEIDHVQIGVYNNDSDSEYKPSKKELGFITERMKNAGWDCIVKTRSSDEISAVFVKMNDEELNQLYIVSLTDEELVVLQVLGNLNKVIEFAINKKGMNLASDF